MTRKIACSTLYPALLWKSGLFVRAFFRKKFSLQRVKRENVENIILAFEKQFADFSDEIYEEAIGE